MVDIATFRPTLDATGYLDIFDAVEVHPCREIDEDNNVEQCEPADAQFWSVYLHYNPNAATNPHMRGVTCIADFETEEQANILAEALDTLLAKILPAGEHIPMR